MQAGSRHDDAAPLLRNLVEIIISDGCSHTTNSRTPSKTPNKQRMSDIVGVEPGPDPSMQEANVWSVSELSDMASVLLNLLYELCGMSRFPTCSNI